MKLLLVKMSSLGDIIHTFPAVTEAATHHPHLQLHWVVEGAFLDLVKHHPAVQRTIPANLRLWRKNPVKSAATGVWSNLKAQIQQEAYDVVIDAQGLLKSAAITRLARGTKWGFDSASAREPWSAKVLDRPVTVSWQLHAIERYRTLFAAALGYTLQSDGLDYGLAAHRVQTEGATRVLLCHGTTWENKHWPEEYWRELAERLVARGWLVDLPHGNETELARAQRLAAGLTNATVLPSMSLMQMLAHMLQRVDVNVAGDTGLAHLAAAAGLPGVTLFGPTDPYYSGVLANNTQNLGANFPCAPCMSRQCQYKREADTLWPPCMKTLSPEHVEQALLRRVESK